MCLINDAVRLCNAEHLAHVLAQLCAPDTRVPGLNDRHPLSGRTPLSEAVACGHLPVVSFLLSRGANPGLAHEGAGPPLLHAAAGGDADLARLLLDAGANIEALDGLSNTALHMACAGNHVDMARCVPGLELVRFSGAAGSLWLLLPSYQGCRQH